MAASRDVHRMSRAAVDRRPLSDRRHGPTCCQRGKIGRPVRGMTGRRPFRPGTIGRYVGLVPRSLVIVTLAATFLMLSGCSTGDRFTGVVTTTNPMLCLGRPKASGDCFDADAKFLKGLQMDDCVTVTYQPRSSRDPVPRGTVTAIERTDECSQWR